MEKNKSNKLLDILLNSCNNNTLVKNFKRMWPYIKPYWFRASLGVILTVPVGALVGAVALFFKPFMEKVMVYKHPHFYAVFPFLIV